MTSPNNTRPPADTHVSVTRSGEFLVLLIDRGRRARRVYLRTDEAAMVVAALTAELPELTVRKGSAS